MRVVTIFIYVYIYFLSKVNIWNATCARATTFSFDTRTDALVKVSNVLGRKGLDLRGALEPPPPTFRFLPNAITIWAIRARHLLSHVFEYWRWRYGYFLSKVNIWSLNCARATAFIFDTRADVLAKGSKFLRQQIRKCLNLRIHAKCSNHYTPFGKKCSMKSGIHFCLPHKIHQSSITCYLCMVMVVVDCHTPQQFPSRIWTLVYFVHGNKFVWSLPISIWQ